MKRKIVIHGTSLLAPGNRNWSALAEHYTLSFADYGSWRSAFLEGHPLLDQADTLLWIFLFEDLIDLSTQCALRTGNNCLAEMADAILLPLKNHLQHSGKKTIVTYSRLGLQLAPPPESSKSLNKEIVIAQKIEGRLMEMKKEFPLLYLYSLDPAFAYEGFKNCVDDRNFYATHCRLSPTGIKIIAENIRSILQRMDEPRKKALILDCDNTLWGGVLGESLMEGIKIGQDGVGLAYRDFQFTIKRLSLEGIILAVASKNNRDDVLQVLERHPGMVLKKEDFASLKINWDDKAENIRQIGQELGLGLDSFVFWDDNPMEREMVRLKLPQVEVIEPDPEISLWPRQLRMYPGFSQFETTEEDKNKTEQYKAKALFTSRLEGPIDKKSYLKSIRMKPTAFEVNEATLQRASQLCAKTNQFNLRTIRHSLEDLRKITADKDSITMIAGLTDKFGDHGLVGLSIVRPAGNVGSAFLDTFLLSCRVIGRCLESWMLHETIGKLKGRGIKSLLAEYIPSGKNGPAESFLKDHGFRPFSDNLHALDLAEARIPNLDIFTDE